MIHGTDPGPKRKRELARTGMSHGKLTMCTCPLSPPFLTVGYGADYLFKVNERGYLKDIYINPSGYFCASNIIHIEILSILLEASIA